MFQKQTLRPALCSASSSSSGHLQKIFPEQQLECWSHLTWGEMRALDQEKALIFTTLAAFILLFHFTVQKYSFISYMSLVLLIDNIFTFKCSQACGSRRLSWQDHMHADAFISSTSIDIWFNMQFLYSLIVSYCQSCTAALSLLQKALLIQSRNKLGRKNFQA